MIKKDMYWVVKRRDGRIRTVRVCEKGDEKIIWDMLEWLEERERLWGREREGESEKERTRRPSLLTFLGHSVANLRRGCMAGELEELLISFTLRQHFGITYLKAILNSPKLTTTSVHDQEKVFFLLRCFIIISPPSAFSLLFSFLLHQHRQY